jgi:hypothetical protein
MDDLKQQVRDQIWWARLQLCRAQRECIYGDEQAWTGYLNALHWVEDFLLDSECQSAVNAAGSRRGVAATTPIDFTSLRG